MLNGRTNGGVSGSKAVSETPDEVRGGKVLSRFRVQRGLSQQECANQTHTSRSMIAQVEQGVRQPSRALLNSFSEGLQLNEVERAILFLAFGQVDARQKNMLPSIIAVIRLDMHLSPGQAQALVALTEQAYKEALKSPVASKEFSSDRENIPAEYE